MFVQYDQQNKYLVYEGKWMSFVVINGKLKTPMVMSVASYYEVFVPINTVQWYMEVMKEAEWRDGIQDPTSEMA